MHAGYQGPPPLDLPRLVLSWQPDPLVLVVLLALGAAYVAGVRRTRDWPSGRSTAFLAGLGVLAIASMSFLDVYSAVLFWVRATQNLLCLMIAPMLLAMGAPLTLLLRTAPATTADRLRRWGRSGPARALTFPVVITVLLVGPLAAVYFTPLYEATLRDHLLAVLVRLGLVVCGFGYFWTRLRIDPTPREEPHLVSFGISLFEAIFDGALGLVLWLGPVVAAGYYQALGRPWGPDARLDQIIGAGVLWIGGDLAGVPYVATLFLRWVRDDEQHAKEIDQVLDEEDAAAEARDGDSGGLWWQDDPVLAERFRRR